jgi:hypothetical protein
MTRSKRKVTETSRQHLESEDGRRCVNMQHPWWKMRRQEKKNAGSNPWAKISDPFGGIAVSSGAMVCAKPEKVRSLIQETNPGC